MGGNPEIAGCHIGSPSLLDDLSGCEVLRSFLGVEYPDSARQVALLANAVASGASQAGWIYDVRPCGFGRVSTAFTMASLARDCCGLRARTACVAIKTVAPDTPIEVGIFFKLVSGRDAELTGLRVPRDRRLKPLACDADGKARSDFPRTNVKRDRVVRGKWASLNSMPVARDREKRAGKIVPEAGVRGRGDAYRLPHARSRKAARDFGMAGFATGLDCKAQPGCQQVTKNQTACRAGSTADQSHL